MKQLIAVIAVLMLAASASAQVYFGSSSFINTPLPANPSIDPHSQDMVNQSLASIASAAHFSNAGYGVGQVLSNATNKVYAVACGNSCGSYNSGTCNVGGSLNFPIPKGVTITSGSDHNMAFIYSAQDGSAYAGKELDCWCSQYNSTNDTWSCGTASITQNIPNGWGACNGSNSLDGNPFPCNGGFAAGIDFAAGAVRPEEIQAGLTSGNYSTAIPHALVVAISTVNGSWIGSTAVSIVCPATHCDKCTSSPNVYPLPEGAHFFLPTSVMSSAQIDAQSWQPWQKMIAHALQNYGAYVVDYGGSFEIKGFSQDNQALNGSTVTWSSVGVPVDQGGDLNMLPWGSMAVIKMTANTATAKGSCPFNGSATGNNAAVSLSETVGPARDTTQYTHHNAGGGTIYDPNLAEYVGPGLDTILAPGTYHRTAAISEIIGGTVTLGTTSGTGTNYIGNTAAYTSFTPTINATPTSCSENFSAIAPSSLSVVQAQQNFISNGSSNTSIAATISSTSGNLLVAYVREGTNATDNFNVTDNLGQTWTRIGSYNTFNSTNRSAIFYVANSKAVSSVTANFTTSGGVTRPGIIVYEIAGAAATSPIDATVANSNTSNTTSLTSLPITTTNANDMLLFAVDVSANQSSFTSGSSFHVPLNATDARQVVAYDIVSNAINNTTTSMSWPSSAQSSGIFTSIKAAPTASWNCAIYTDLNNAPNSLLCSNIIGGTPVVGNNNLLALSCPTVAANTKYWLAVNSNNAANAIGISGASGGYYSNTTYGSWPTTATGLNSSGSYNGTVSLAGGVSDTVNFAKTQGPMVETVGPAADTLAYAARHLGNMSESLGPAADVLTALTHSFSANTRSISDSVTASDSIVSIAAHFAADSESVGAASDTLAGQKNAHANTASISDVVFNAGAAGFSTVGSGNNYFGNLMLFAEFSTGSAPVTVSSCSIYLVGAVASSGLQCAIYTDNNTAPQNLVCSRTTGLVAQTGWNVLSLSGCGTLPANSKYWVAFNSGNTNNDTTQYSSCTANCTSYYKSSALGTWPASLTGISSVALPYNEYVTVTPTSIGDMLVSQGQHFAAPTETVSSTDSILPEVNNHSFFASMADSATGADTLAGLAAHFGVPTEHVTASDSLAVSQSSHKNYTTNMADTLTIGSSIVAGAAHFATKADSVGPTSDSIIAFVAHPGKGISAVGFGIP